MFLGPASFDLLRRCRCILAEIRHHQTVALGAVATEFAHARMSVLDAGEDGDARWRSRMTLDDEASGAAEVGLYGLVEEGQLEATLDVGKRRVNILQSLRLGAECIDQARFGVEELLGQHGSTHCFRHRAPFRQIASKVWGAKEDDGVGGDVEGSLIIDIGARDASRQFQHLLDQDTA